jgi:hypothetical protein
MPAHKPVTELPIVVLEPPDAFGGRLQAAKQRGVRGAMPVWGRRGWTTAGGVRGVVRSRLGGLAGCRARTSPNRCGRSGCCHWPTIPSTRGQHLQLRQGEVVHRRLGGFGGVVGKTRWMDVPRAVTRPFKREPPRLGGSRRYERSRKRLAVAGAPAASSHLLEPSKISCKAATTEFAHPTRGNRW